MTALHWAALGNSESIAEILLNSGAVMPIQLDVHYEYQCLLVSKGFLQGPAISASFRGYSWVPKYGSAASGKRS